MTMIWLRHGWRQQCAKRKQLQGYLQQAKQLGFDQYCSLRVGQQWWLCCAVDDGRQQQQQDIVVALRQQFVQTEQLLALLHDGEQLLCISWDQQQLLVALLVANDPSGQQQLLLVLHGLWQRQHYQPLILHSAELPLALRQQLPDTSAQQGFSVEQIKPCRAARLVSLNQPPPWQRWRRMLLLMSSALALLSVGWLYYWPGSQQPPAELRPLSGAVEQTPQLVGMPVDVLLLLREQLQQLDLLAGWQPQQVDFSAGQLQLTLQQSYGDSAELRQQLPAPWQITQTAQQLQVSRSFNLLATALQFDQPVTEALQQLQQQATLLFPKLHWQMGRSGANNRYTWRDVSLRFGSWYWLELSQLQQLLQGFDARLLRLQLSVKPESLITLELRIYQSISQGDDDDSSMDVSTGVYQ